MQPAKALEAIGKALQAQYERWQPRAKYKTQLDPTVEDVKKLCQSCRRNAKNERVLLHYNGHGVPRPTSNGEIWVFNKSYTQYIPLSVYDLQSWTGNPAIYVFDCGGAGVLVDAFLQLAQRGGLAKPTPQTAANPSPNGAASDQAPRVAGDDATSSSSRVCVPTRQLPPFSPEDAPREPPIRSPPRSSSRASRSRRRARSSSSRASRARRRRSSSPPPFPSQPRATQSQSRRRA